MESKQSLLFNPAVSILEVEITKKQNKTSLEDQINKIIDLDEKIKQKESDPFQLEVKIPSVKKEELQNNLEIQEKDEKIEHKLEDNKDYSNQSKEDIELELINELEEKIAQKKRDLTYIINVPGSDSLQVSDPRGHLDEKQIADTKYNATKDLQKDLFKLKYNRAKRNSFKTIESEIKPTSKPVEIIHVKKKNNKKTIAKPIYNQIPYKELAVEELKKKVPKITRKGVLDKEYTKLYLRELADNLFKYFNLESKSGVTLSDIIKEKKAQMEDPKKHISQEQLIKMFTEKQRKGFRSLPHAPPAELKEFPVNINRFNLVMKNYNMQSLPVREFALVPKLSTLEIEIDSEATTTNKINLSKIILSKPTGNDKRIALKVPFPDLLLWWKRNNKSGERPLYYPKYHKVHYDRSLLGSFRMAVQTGWTIYADPSITPLYIKEYTATVTEIAEQEKWYKKLVTCAEKFYYGNGSLYGQMGRWTACLKVHDYQQECLKRKDYYRPGMEPFTDFLIKNIFTKPIIEIPDSVNMDFVEISDYLQNNGYKGIEITKEAGDGLLMGNYKKSESILSDFLLAKAFMKDLDQEEEIELRSWLSSNINQKVDPEDLDSKGNEVRRLANTLKTVYDCQLEKLEMYIAGQFEVLQNNCAATYEDWEAGHFSSQPTTWGDRLDDIKLDTKVGTSASKFWDKWFFFRFARMKPKAEVYEKGTDDPESDLEKQKTRNYWEANFAIFLPFVSLVCWLYADKASPLIDMDCHALTGWDPTSSGIHNLIMRVHKRFHWMKTNGTATPGRLIDYFVFCDNLYIAVVNSEGTDWDWISLDGSKMEASSDHEFGKMVAAIFSSIFKGRVSRAIMNYINIVIAPVLTNMYSVLGEAVFAVPFLTSGSVGTSLTNNLKMSMLIMNLLRLTNQGEKPILVLNGKKKRRSALQFSDLAETAFAQVGVILKIERVSFGVEQKVSEGKYLNLDLLGYGGIPIKVNIPVEGFKPTIRIFPYLDKVRLNQMLMFMRLGPKDSGDIAGNARNLMVRLLKLKIAYIYGLWTSSAQTKMVGIAIQDTVEHLITYGEEAKKLNAQFSEYSDFLEEAYDVFGIETVLNNLADRTLPSFMTIVRINLGKAQFKLWMDQIEKASSTEALLGQGLISMTDLVEYLGKDQVEKIYKEGVIPKKLFEVTLFSPEKVYAIIKLASTYKQAILPATFSLAKVGAIKEKDLSQFPLTTLPFKKISAPAHPITMISFNKLFTSQQDFYYTPIKTVVNNVDFVINPPINSLYSLLYSMYCFYLSSKSQVNYELVMTMTRDFPFSCFNLMTLLIILKKVVNLSDKLHMDLQLPKNRIIMDPKILQFPEYIYLYIFKLVKIMRQGTSDSDKLFEAYRYFPYSLKSVDFESLDKLPVDNNWGTAFSKFMVGHYQAVLSNFKEEDDRTYQNITTKDTYLLRLEYYLNMKNKNTFDIKSEFENFDKWAFITVPIPTVFYMQTYSNVKKSLHTSITKEVFEGQIKVLRNPIYNLANYKNSKEAAELLEALLE